MESLHILIVANGSKPSDTMLYHYAKLCNKIVAADGGASFCLGAGIKPDLIVGDMDSFEQDPDTENLTIIVDEDQETNDLEKALKHAKLLHGNRVTILGATGIRLDQTLKNISVMLQFSKEFEELVMRDDLCWIRIIPNEFSFSTDRGTVVSLFPLSGRVDGITTTGLKYALNNEFLENGVRDGSSNEAVSDIVTISYHSGSLVLIVFEKMTGLAQWP